MVTPFIIVPSWRKHKKFAVLIGDSYDKDIIHFGDNRYEDYTIHKDITRKENYIKRHEKNEDWEDISTAGFWSRYLLWNKQTLEESAKDISRMIKKPVKLILD